ncbi:MAG TPA: YeeE/YedE family protein [Burkholderiales bacterium]
MELTNVHYVALWGFIVAAVFGAVANRTRFCTMGAISDWLHMGDTARLRAWFLAIGVAILGVQALQWLTPIDMRQSIYLTTNFGWLGHLLGGLLFGIGMTLGSGCGQRTLVRLGGGNLKSLVVLLVLGFTAYMTLRGLLALVRVHTVERTNVDLAAYGMADQSLASFLAKLTGSTPGTGFATALAVVVGLGLLAFVFSSASFRRRADQIVSGLVIGLCVVAGWYITGVYGFDDFEPLRVESYTFVAPVADNLQYLMTFTGSTISFGIAAVFGMIFGSFVYAIATGSFRLEGFASTGDLLAHLAGGALMGFGGVLGLGCTIGQGISGMSTLAAGSVLTLGSIILGSALTMKVQYHLLDEVGFLEALRRALADLRLLPAARKPKTV